MRRQSTPITPRETWLNWFDPKREEKVLPHVAMVAKFLDDKKPKTSLKKWIYAVSNSFKLAVSILFCSI